MLSLLSVKRTNTTVELVASLSFFIYLFTEFVFRNTPIGQIGVLFFLGAIFLLICCSSKAYISCVLFFSLALMIYFYVRVQDGSSIEPSVSMAMIKTLTFNLMIGFCLYNYMRKVEIEKVLNLFVLASFLTSVFAVVISAPNILHARLGGEFTLMGLTISVNPNYIALLCGYSSLFLIFRYLKRRNYKDLFKVLWFALVILLSGSRKGIFSLVLMPPILAFWMFPNRRFRILLIAVVVFIVSYWAIMNVPALYDLIGVRVEGLALKFKGEEITEASLKTRDSFFKTGWNTFLERPWRGFGVDCFREFPFSYGTYSHCNYVELLVSGGIPALIIYYASHISGLLSVFNKSVMRNDIAKLAVLMLCQIAIFDFAMVSYFDRAFLVVLIIALSILRALKSNTVKEACFNLSI